MQGAIRLGKCLRIVSDATKSIFWGHTWLEKCPKLVSDAVFEKQANKINEKAGTEPYPPRSEKRVKTRGFRNIFEKNTEERVALWMELKSKKRMKTHCFWWVFEAWTPRKSSQKSFGPARWFGIRQKWDLGACKHAQGLRPNLEKRVKTRGFRNVSEKS